MEGLGFSQSGQHDVIVMMMEKELIQPGTVDHYVHRLRADFFNPPTSTRSYTVLLCGKQYVVSSVVAGEGLEGS